MRMEKVEEAARVALEFSNALTRGDTAAAAGLIGPECRFEAIDKGFRMAAAGNREDAARLLDTELAAGVGANFKVEELLGYGNRCVLRWNLPINGGRGFGGDTTVSGVHIFRVRGGIITERLSYLAPPIG